MDCYLIGDDTLAEMHARELLRKTTNPDGSSGLPIAAPRPASRSISSRPAWRPRTRDQPRQRALAISLRSKSSLLLGRIEV
jgi:hypothetical protein